MREGQPQGVVPTIRAASSPGPRTGRINAPPTIESRHPRRRGRIHASRAVSVDAGMRAVPERPLRDGRPPASRMGIWREGQPQGVVPTPRPAPSPGPRTGRIYAAPYGREAASVSIHASPARRSAGMRGGAFYGPRGVQCFRRGGASPAPPRDSGTARFEESKPWIPAFAGMTAGDSPYGGRCGFHGFVGETRERFHTCVPRRSAGMRRGRFSNRPCGRDRTGGGFHKKPGAGDRVVPRARRESSGVRFA